MPENSGVGFLHLVWRSITPVAGGETGGIVSVRQRDQDGVENPGHPVPRHRQDRQAEGVVDKAGRGARSGRTRPTH